MRLQREIKVFRGDESVAFLDSIPCFSAFLREFRRLRTVTRAPPRGRVALTPIFLGEM